MNNTYQRNIDNLFRDESIRNFSESEEKEFQKILAQKEDPNDTHPNFQSRIKFSDFLKEQEHKMELDKNFQIKEIEEKIMKYIEKKIRISL